MIGTLMIVVLFSTLMMNGTAKKGLVPVPSPKPRKKLGKKPLPSPPTKKETRQEGTTFTATCPPKKRLGQRMGFIKLGGFTLTATMNNTTITAVEGNCPHKHPENTTIGRVN